MEIQVLKNDNIVIQLKGRLDTTTSPQLDQKIKEIEIDKDVVVLDFKELEYISSAGLRVILFAQKTMNSQGSMSVTHVNSDIMEVFELTGFTDILTII